VFKGLIWFCYFVVSRRREETLQGWANAFWEEACKPAWRTSCIVWSNNQRIGTASEWKTWV